MKLALLGYGKMGHEIEKIALDRGHSVVLKKNLEDSFEGLELADVAIDFSTPAAAFTNISTCLDQHIPIVSGTTGWLNQYDQIVELTQKNEGAFLYGSNFSLGVNLFFELNEHLARLMAPYDYEATIEEIHHTQKLDAPSGTAISLAQGIIAHSSYTDWSLEKTQKNILPIQALRTENVPGTHTVTYKSEVDAIEVRHTAFSRKGFALGAVVAAEWLIGKKGVFSMKDVLNLGK